MPDEGKETEEIQVEELEEKTPTAEEQRLQEELSRVTEELTGTKKGLSTAHQRLTQKDVELKRQVDLHGRLDDLEDKLKLLVAAQAAGINVSEEEIEEMPVKKRQDLTKIYENLDKEQKTRREQAQKRAEAEAYKAQADALYARAQTVFTNDEEALEKVEDYLTYGRLDRAEKRIAQAEKPPAKESEEERIERLVQERLAKENPLLKTDSIIPSGRTKKREETLDRFNAGDTSVSLKDAEEALRG